VGCILRNHVEEELSCVTGCNRSDQFVFFVCLGSKRPAGMPVVC
jgi:hypothetical protein